jgi:hypothetical protein
MEHCVVTAAFGKPQHGPWMRSDRLWHIQHIGFSHVRDAAEIDPLGAIYHRLAGGHSLFMGLGEQYLTDVANSDTLFS